MSVQSVRTHLGENPLNGEGFRLRLFEPGDRESIARHLNDRAVWLNLTDRIVHPYRLGDADEWIALQVEARRRGQIHHLAVEVEGEACGSIGIEPFNDLARLGAEVGYWIGREYWGKGIGTAALTGLTKHIFEATDLIRLQATIIEWNPSSCRVAEKAGYVCEGRLRRSIVKNGKIADSLLYARVRE